MVAPWLSNQCEFSHLRALVSVDSRLLQMLILRYPLGLQVPCERVFRGWFREPKYLPRRYDWSPRDSGCSMETDIMTLHM